MPWLDVHRMLLKLWGAYWTLKEAHPVKAEAFKEVIITITKSLREDTGDTLTKEVMCYYVGDALVAKVSPVVVAAPWCDACKMAHEPFQTR